MALSTDPAQSLASNGFRRVVILLLLVLEVRILSAMTGFPLLLLLSLPPSDLFEIDVLDEAAVSQPRPDA